MTTTSEILDAARRLGRLIAEHPASKKYLDAVKSINDDREAQRLLADYSRQINAIQEKEANLQPVEVEDKRKLQELQEKVVMNARLRDFQVAQMDYVDLMRRVDEAIAEASAPPAPPPNIAGTGGVA